MLRTKKVENLFAFVSYSPLNGTLVPPKWQLFVPLFLKQYFPLKHSPIICFIYASSWCMHTFVWLWYNITKTQNVGHTATSSKTKFGKANWKKPVHSSLSHQHRQFFFCCLSPPACFITGVLNLVWLKCAPLWNPPSLLSTPIHLPSVKKREKSWILHLVQPHPELQSSSAAQLTFTAFLKGTVHPKINRLLNFKTCMLWSHLKSKATMYDLKN